jgi:hypothetical protein
MNDHEITAALALAEECGGRGNYRETHPLDPDPEMSDYGQVYSEDGYCQACGNGMWKYHMPRCEIADLANAARRLALDLQWARAFIKVSTGEDMADLMAREVKMVEVFGPRDQADQG